MNWIDVNDEYPCINECVLCFDDQNEFISIGRLVEDFVFELMYIEKVEGDSVITHWMPLPDGPIRKDE